MDGAGRFAWVRDRLDLLLPRILLGGLSLLLLAALVFLLELVPFLFPRIGNLPALLPSVIVFGAVLLWLFLFRKNLNLLRSLRDVAWLHVIPAGLLLLCYGNISSPSLFLLLPVALFAFVVAPFAPYTSTANIRSAYWRSFLLLPAGTVVIYALWSLLNVGVVVAQAEIYAAGSPYCVQHQGQPIRRFNKIASDVAIKSLTELRGDALRSDATMWTGGSGPLRVETYNFHALLIIEKPEGTEYRNWSYLHQHFDFVSQETIRGKYYVRKNCEATPHFLIRLPLV